MGVNFFIYYFDECKLERNKVYILGMFRNSFDAHETGEAAKDTGYAYTKRFEQAGEWHVFVCVCVYM